MIQPNAKRWLYAWFSERAALPDPSVCHDTNYFEAKWIDSFAVIELIEAAETEFGVKFEAEHFQDRRFQTFNGLAEIIEEFKGGKSK